MKANNWNRPPFHRRRCFVAARAFMCLAIAFAALGALPTPARACSGATHHEIVERALDALQYQDPHLYTILNQHRDAVTNETVFLPLVGK